MRTGGLTGTPVVLSGTIAAGGTFVVCHSSIDAVAASRCDITISTISHNGDDAYDLVCGGVVLDTFGRIGEDPGTEWTGGGLSTVDHVLQRRCTVTMGDTVGGDVFDPSVEWTGGPWTTPTTSLAGLGNRAECP